MTTGARKHLVLSMTQMKAEHTPYRGVSAALNDLLGGRIDFLLDFGATLQCAKNGKLRILADGSLTRVPQAPDVPTLDEHGLKGFDGDTVFGLYAAAGTPHSVIARINSEVNRLLKSGPTKERIAVGGQLPQPMTQTEFARKSAQDTQALRQPDPNHRHPHRVETVPRDIAARDIRYHRRPIRVPPTSLYSLCLSTTA